MPPHCPRSHAPPHPSPALLPGRMEDLAARRVEGRATPSTAVTVGPRWGLLHTPLQSAFELKPQTCLLSAHGLGFWCQSCDLGIGPAPGSEGGRTTWAQAFLATVPGPVRLKPRKADGWGTRGPRVSQELLGAIVPQDGRLPRMGPEEEEGEPAVEETGEDGVLGTRGGL